MSVPADLTIMGINLAKITILSYSGLPADCHGLTRDNCKSRYLSSYLLCTDALQLLLHATDLLSGT